MSETSLLTNKFHSSSSLEDLDTQKRLKLQLPIQEDGKYPFLFRGRITNPFIFGKTLRTLSRVVASRYFIPANALQKIIALRDPVVSVGNHKIRLEGFSTCCGVYAKIDIDQNNTESIKLNNGTTNVDFNTEMLNQLSKLRNDDNLILEIGEESLTLTTDENEVIEKKVPLPKRWLKGLANTQAFLAKMECKLILSKIQAVQLIRSLPKNLNNKTSLFLTTNIPYRWSTIEAPKSIQINGAERLRLIEDIASYTKELCVYASDQHNVSAWRFCFEGIDFTLVISEDVWRGFSGEGQLLNDLSLKTDRDLTESIRNKFKENDSVNKYIFSVLNDYSDNEVDGTLARLASSGLLGYDLISREYYYRELPIKPSDEFELNPRHKSALKLLDAGHVEVISTKDSRTEANVKGTEVEHHVVITESEAKCTCLWYGKHHGIRGDCKHILAVKIKIGKDAN